MSRPLRTASLWVAAFAVTGPMAHVLEMPNKLALEGPLWLAVQQHLYRGWGFVFGPVEIAALLLSLALAWLRRDAPSLRPTLWAAGAQAAMLGVFFAFNDPVNAALNGWTAATLPPDWAGYRVRWETGHALAALLAVVALLLLVRAALCDPRPEGRDRRAPMR